MSTGAWRLDGSVRRGPSFQFIVDGERVKAYEGETVATAFLLHGRRHQRLTSRHGEPRGLFCGMGVCFECVATINGVPNVRTCTTQAAPGMVVSTVQDLPHEQHR